VITERDQHGILKIDLDTLPLIVEMMATGMPVDREHLGELSADFQARIDIISEWIYEEIGRRVNLSSPIEKAKILFEDLRLRVVKRSKLTRAPSVDSEVIETLKAENDPPPPVLDMLLEREKYTKLDNTYASGLVPHIRANGRIHSRIQTTRTSTGRLASQDPNVQNIPTRSAEGNDIRNAFIAPPGRVMLSVDLDQIEMRCAAHISGDVGLCNIFLAGLDVHSATAAETLGKAIEAVTKDERRAAKSTNFGIIYAMSEHGLSKQLGWTVQRALAYLELYLSRYPGIHQYMEDTKAHLLTYGWIDDLFGRRRYIPESMSEDYWVLEEAYKQAINMPVQSTAQGIIKIAMGGVKRALARRGLTDIEWYMQVHDELLFGAWEKDWETAARTVVGVMESAVTLKVPVLASVKRGYRWGSLEAVKLTA